MAIACSHRDMVDCFIAHMQGMIKESNRRMATCHGAGIWYAAKYYQTVVLKNPQTVTQWQNPFFHGRIPPGIAEPIADPKSPTGIKSFCFVLKKGVLPSFAVTKIEEGISFLDCATFVALALYKALMEVLGQETFNRLFAADSPSSFRLSLDAKSPLATFVLKQPIASEKEVKRGDICYFSNIVDYVAKHPAGSSRGYHQVCVRENPHRYVSMGLSAEGFDWKKTERELWDCFNMPPLDRGFFSPHVWDYLYAHYYKGDIARGRALVESFSAKKLSWEEFQKKPSRLAAIGLPCENRMGLWVYRIDPLFRNKLQ